MDFEIPSDLTGDVDRFKAFMAEQLIPNLSSWYQKRTLPRDLFLAMGQEGRFGFELKEGRLFKQPALRAALAMEQLALVSPGVAVAVLVHIDLGLMGLWLFGSDALKQQYAGAALEGNTLICLGNTEPIAGSDVANIAARAEKVEGGWVLNGTKAYVTNGIISDLAVVTAITDPEGSRNRRVSMFMVDLTANGVSRKKLNKQVWIPSDLTRLQFEDVFVPEDHLMGEPECGLQQVLTIFTHSRVAISALTLGTALGAFEMALDHARKRDIFGSKIVEFQAKAFEIADFYAKIEAARLMVWKAACTMDKGREFRLESSMAKYLSVNVAREVAVWAADLFGAASVIFEHPVHKFPMDAWGASLGEGTQDVQKLIIFREVIKRYSR